MPLSSRAGAVRSPLEVTTSAIGAARAPVHDGVVDLSLTRSGAAITVTGVRKSLGDHLVLDGIDFSVSESTVFALLGPNGSGRTTTVHILSTRLAADAGHVRIAGHDVARDPDAVRAAIGLTGQFSAVDELLTGRENLALMADLQHLARADGRRRIAALLERFDIVDAADKLAATYSGGMRRRLDLAMTLIGSPRIIFLDEPTTGLDPRSPRAMWQVIRGLVADGTTVFLTTQYLEEADQLADHIAILDGARLVAQGTPEQLKRHIHDGHVDLRFADAASLRSAADVLATDGNVATRRRVLGELDYAGIDVEDMSIHTPDLDDVF
jgi:ABC-2 type transport system ATP-binding protein